MVRFLARPGLRPECLAVPLPQAKDSTTAIVRRIFTSFTLPRWHGLLWGLALAGLLLLPSNYRAGAEIAHGHALMQLWLEAGSGAIHHHDHRIHPAVHGGSWDWLDPATNEPTQGEAGPAADERPDVAGQQGSTLPGGVHLLVGAVAPIALAAARHVVAAVTLLPPESQVVGVLLPPPRWTSLAG